MQAALQAHLRTGLACVKAVLVLKRNGVDQPLVINSSPPIFSDEAIAAALSCPTLGGPTYVVRLLCSVSLAQQPAASVWVWFYALPLNLRHQLKAPRRVLPHVPGTFTRTNQHQTCTYSPSALAVPWAKALADTMTSVKHNKLPPRPPAHEGVIRLAAGHGSRLRERPVLRTPRSNPGLEGLGPYVALLDTDSSSSGYVGSTCGGERSLTDLSCTSEFLSRIFYGDYGTPGTHFIWQIISMTRRADPNQTSWTARCMNPGAPDDPPQHEVSLNREQVERDVFATQGTPHFGSRVAVMFPLLRECSLGVVVGSNATPGDNPADHLFLVRFYDGDLQDMSEGELQDAQARYVATPGLDPYSEEPPYRFQVNCYFVMVCGGDPVISPASRGYIP